MSDELVAWLREQIAADRARWVTCKALGDIDEGTADDLIARCEAELAILNEYEDAELDAMQDAERLGVPAAQREAVARADPATEALGRTVRHLARGYRHRPGYKEEWKP